MAGPWEKDLPHVNYYHPINTPPPPMVGKLTVPAEEINWDGTAWSMTSDRFVVAGAMHLANELNWFGPHLGSLPFPLATDEGPGIDGATVAVDGELAISADNTQFDTQLIRFEAGQEITVSFDNRQDGVDHNIHVLAGGAGDFRTPIEEGPVAQTLTLTINEPGRYTFVCDVHSQMTGTVDVTG